MCVANNHNPIDLTRHRRVFKLYSHYVSSRSLTFFFTLLCIIWCFSASYSERKTEEINKIMDFSEFEHCWKHLEVHSSLNHTSRF